MELDEKINIIENMEKYGGSFVVALANLILHADLINLKKIENAFPEYIKSYKGKVFYHQ